MQPNKSGAIGLADDDPCLMQGKGVEMAFVFAVLTPNIDQFWQRLLIASVGRHPMEGK